MTSSVTPELDLMTLVLKAGHHRSKRDGACVMDMVSYLNGEPWSDRPTCACPVLATFLRTLNDHIPTDAERTHLLVPLIPLLVGSRADDQTERRRLYRLADFTVREALPLALEAVGLTASAMALRQLPPVVDRASASAAAVAFRADAAAAAAFRTAAAYATSYAVTAADAATVTTAYAYASIAAATYQLHPTIWERAVAVVTALLSEPRETAAGGQAVVTPEVTPTGANGAPATGTEGRAN